MDSFLSSDLSAKNTAHHFTCRLDSVISLTRGTHVLYFAWYEKLTYSTFSYYAFYICKNTLRFLKEICMTYSVFTLLFEEYGCVVETYHNSRRFLVCVHYIIYTIHYIHYIYTHYIHYTL